MKYLANFLMWACDYLHWIPGYKCQLATWAFRIAEKYDPKCKWEGWNQP